MGCATGPTASTLISSHQHWAVTSNVWSFGKTQLPQIHHGLKTMHIVLRVWKRLIYLSQFAFTETTRRLQKNAKSACKRSTKLRWVTYPLVHVLILMYCACRRKWTLRRSMSKPIIHLRSLIGYRTSIVATAIHPRQWCSPEHRNPCWFYRHASDWLSIQEEIDFTRAHDCYSHGYKALAVRHHAASLCRLPMKPKFHDLDHQHRDAVLYDWNPVGDWCFESEDTMRTFKRASMRCHSKGQSKRVIENGSFNF